MKILLYLSFAAALISCGPITQEVNGCVSNNRLGGQIKQQEEIEIKADSVVQIGEQFWLTSNLQTSLFSNGDFIPLILDTCLWTETKNPARTYYFNSKLEGFENVYGTYYNAAAMMDERGICPKGWRVPNLNDWLELKNYIVAQEQTDSISPFLAHLPAFWPDTMVVNNKYHFNAIATGFRGMYGGFQDQNEYAFWWIMPDSIGEQLKVFELASHDLKSYTMNTKPQAGFCIRCIRE